MMLIADDEKGPKWIADELFGRDDEINLLTRLAEEKTSSCVLLRGGDGSGKTSLIQSIAWEPNDWVFVTGKYDESLSAEPYSALVRVLDKLVEVWSINNSKSQVCQMGDFCKILDDAIELLENVVPGMLRVVEKFSHRNYISKKSSLKDLGKLHTGPKEAITADSVAVAAAFLRIFSFLSSARPICLFLDDIHHADAASLQVLELMAYAAASDLSETTTHILLAMSFTDEGIDKNQLASKTIKSIQAFESSNVHALSLTDLDVEHVNDLLVSVVNHDSDVTLPLATVIHKKTGGNPFFVGQFLRFAREKDFFKFDPQSYKWAWDDVELLETYAKVSDNVAEMLALSMDKLCLATQVVLKVASCLGKIIPKDVLVEHFRSYDEDGQGHTSCAAVVGVKETGLEYLLDDAVKAGILVKSMTQGAYIWSNDRLLHVAYSFIPTEFRHELHLKLGNLLWKLGLERNEEWMIFMAASQMNTYADLQLDSSLGNEVARLNLHAAKLSLNKAAIFPAHELLSNAENHMDIVGRWAVSYELTLDILTNLAETKMKIGEVDGALEIARVIVDNATSLNDKFRAYVVLLQGLVSGTSRDYDLGVEKTLELLKLYGEKTPKKLLPGQKCVEKAKLKKMLPGGELEGLLELPDMVDEKALQVQTLLVNHLSPYAFLSGKKRTLGWFASVRAVKNACKHGISHVTNMAVLQMAIQLRMEGHYKEAAEYADFALLLSERIPRKLGSNHGSVRFVGVGGVFSCVRSFNNCLNELVEGRGECLRAGLPKDAVLASLSYALGYLCVGLPLSSIDSDLTSFAADAKQIASPYTVQQVFLLIRQAVFNLQNSVADPSTLTGKIMNQDAEIEKVEGHGRDMTLRDVNTFRLMLCCVYGDWESAESLVDDLEKYLDKHDGFFFRSHFRRTYMGLAAFALSRNSNSIKKRRKYLSMGKKVLKSFSTELKYGSVNAFPIVAMLEAEESPSKQHYDKAIKACARLGLVHHEAYMCERAGDYFMKNNDEGWGEFYLAEAILLYGEWGATGKSDSLTQDYSHILRKSSLRESVNSSLQGRTRYSSKELDSLRTINWDSFSIGSND